MATPAGGVDILDALMIIDRQTSAAPHLTLSMVPQLIHINGCDAAITSKSSLADGESRRDTATDGSALCA